MNTLLNTLIMYDCSGRHNVITLNICFALTEFVTKNCIASCYT